jgi:hypothetical protein
MYELLKRVHAELGELRVEVRDLKTRLTILEGHIGGIIASQQLTNERLDRLEVRFERVERRLDLVEAH